MSGEVHHFCSLLSPWVLMGWEGLEQICDDAGVPVRHRFVDLPRVFKANGGQPGGKKSPEKQAYRLTELRRWSRHRGLDLILQPAHHPFDAGLATRLVLAAEAREDDAAALARTFMGALWLEDANLADADALAELMRRAGLPPEPLFSAADEPEVRQRLEENTRDAIRLGVFGVPTYVYRGELFWGQDRLYFLAQALAGGESAA